MLVRSAAVIAAASTINRSYIIHQAHPPQPLSLSKMSDSERGSIICAGLSCLDLQLVGCTQSGTDEAIERYDEAVHCAGGSASMTGTTLALLFRKLDGECHHDEEVHILTKIGPDFGGTTLVEFYRRAGASTDLVLIDDASRTSMAVLPVFKNGKRGCFVNLACNDGFTTDELLMQVEHAAESVSNPARALLFGYPHLMPKMQGHALQSMLSEARKKLSVSGASVLVGVDLNGVDGSDPSAAREALFPALNEIDVLHLNEDEAMLLSSTESTRERNDATSNNLSPELLSQIASLHGQGCAVILLSLGSKGAFVSVTPDSQRLEHLSSDLTPMSLSQWTPGLQLRIPAFKIGHGMVNANGAGDALFSGFCLAASSWGCVVARQMCVENEWRVTPQVAGTFASLVAWQRCDTKTRDGVGMKSATELMHLIYTGNLPENLDDDL